MRDIFDDIFKSDPLDPMEAARRHMRPNLSKRFYERVEVSEAEGGYRILLDGRPVKTPAKRALLVPGRALAQAIAAEWDAQRETIDPAAMPLTRLANSIIDGVVDACPAVAEDIVKYLGSDLVFYRADGPEGLVEHQARHWDPVLRWARNALGARFILAEGVVFAPQPQEALDAARAALPADAWRLGAMHSITALTGSALIALALAHGGISPEDAWTAAHADEDWNVQAWGRDEQAMERRRYRRGEMQAAVTVLQALGRDKI